MSNDREATSAKWFYLANMFVVFCICALIGSCCAMTEWRMAKEAEFKAKERP